MSTSSPTKVAVSGFFSGFGVETSLAGAEGEADRHLNSHHNSQSSFARLPLGAAESRQAGSPPPGLPTPSIIHHDHQMTPHSKGWGNPLGTSCAETLAGRTIAQDWPLRRAGFRTFLPITRRGVVQAPRHFFRVRVGSSRRSAIQFKSLERHFQCLPKRHKSHSVNSIQPDPKLSRGQVNDVPQFKASGATHDR